MNTELYDGGEKEGTKWEMAPDTMSSIVSQPSQFSSDGPWLYSNATQVRLKYWVFEVEYCGIKPMSFSCKVQCMVSVLIEILLSRLKSHATRAEPHCTDWATPLAVT